MLTKRSDSQESSELEDEEPISQKDRILRAMYLMRVVHGQPNEKYSMTRYEFHSYIVLV